MKPSSLHVFFALVGSLVANLAEAQKKIQISSSSPGNLLYDQITGFFFSPLFPVPNVPFNDYTDLEPLPGLGYLDIFDSEAADDFTVPPDKSWKLTAIEIRTIASRFNREFTNYTINIYEDADGKPDVNGSGRLSYMSLNVTRPPWPPSGCPVENCTIPRNNYTISFGPTPPLRSGETYWIGLQAVGEFLIYNDTFWILTYPQSGNPGQWRNPGNGYAIFDFVSGTKNCTSFGTIAECFSDTNVNEYPDMLFRLYGHELPETCEISGDECTTGDECVCECEW